MTREWIGEMEKSVNDNIQKLRADLRCLKIKRAPKNDPAIDSSMSSAISAEALSDLITAYLQKSIFDQDYKDDGFAYGKIKRLYHTLLYRLSNKKFLGILQNTDDWHAVYMIDNLPLSIEQRADLFTELAKSATKNDRHEWAEYLASRAYFTHPKDWRLKWWLFKCVKIGRYKKAHLILQNLSPMENVSEAQRRMLEELQNGYKSEISGAVENIDAIN